MSSIDNDTLLISLQSVYEGVARFKGLLESGSLKGPENQSY